MWVLWRIFNYWWIIDAVMTLKSNNCPGVSVLPPEFIGVFGNNWKLQYIRCIYSHSKTYPQGKAWFSYFRRLLATVIFSLGHASSLSTLLFSKNCATEMAMILCAILEEFISGWYLVIFFLIKVFWVGKLWSLMFNFFTNWGTQDFL